MTHLLFIWSTRLCIRSTLYFLYGQLKFFIWPTFTFYMVKSSFYTVNYLLFIWSTRVFKWSTFYFLWASHNLRGLDPRSLLKFFRWSGWSLNQVFLLPLVCSLQSAFYPQSALNPGLRSAVWNLQSALTLTDIKSKKLTIQKLELTIWKTKIDLIKRKSWPHKNSSWSYKK